MTPKPPPGFDLPKPPAATPPPPAGFEPVDVPAFRNSASAEEGLQHKSAVPKPSAMLQDQVAKVTGDTAADWIGYAPPVAIMNTWLDAAAEEKVNPEQRNAGTRMLEEYENIHRGAAQGTDPYVQAKDGREELGEAFEDAGGAWMFQTPEGRAELVNPKKHVVLKDQKGKLRAYSRSEQTDDNSGVGGAARLFSMGVLTGPLTGPQRAMRLGTENAGKFTAGQASKAADDYAAFQRQGVPVLSPAFAQAPTQALAKGLSESFFIGAPLQKSIKNTYQGLADATERLATNLGGARTFDEAGRSIQRGLDRTRTAKTHLLEPGVLQQMGIEPNAPFKAADVMSKQAVKRAAAAAPVRAQYDGGLAQTSRGVNIPMARTRSQAMTARRTIDDMGPDEVLAIARAPAQQTSFASKAEALYKLADDKLPALMRSNNTKNSDTFQATNTRNLVRQLGDFEKKTGVPGGVLGRYSAMAEKLDNNQQLQTFRNMRTAVGRDLSNFNYGDVGLDRQQLKAMYAALSRDIEIGYQDLANRAWDQVRLGRMAPDQARMADRALTELKRADAYYSAGMQRMEDFARVAGAETPEAAARRMITAAQEGGGANFGMFRQAMRVLRPEERNDLAALVLREMVKPNPSAAGLAAEAGFSPSSFLTRYNRMDPRMRNLLFPGDHGAALNDIAAITGRLKRVERFENLSGSGRMATNVGGAAAGISMLTSGAWAHLAGLAGGLYGVSYMLSRPQYARWTANYLNMRAVAERSPQQVNAAMLTHVNRLAQMARLDPQLEPIVRAITEELGVQEGTVGHGQEHEDHSGAQGQESQQRESDKPFVGHEGLRGGVGPRYDEYGKLKPGQE